MPGSYRCPKGGQHRWEAKGKATEDAHRVCKKCGQAAPSAAKKSRA